MPHPPNPDAIATIGRAPTQTPPHPGTIVHTCQKSLELPQGKTIQSTEPMKLARQGGTSPCDESAKQLKLLAGQWVLKYGRVVTLRLTLVAHKEII
jgi:hypothetical protein